MKKLLFALLMSAQAFAANPRVLNADVVEGIKTTKNYIKNSSAELPLKTKGWATVGSNNVSVSISGISGATFTTSGAHGFGQGDAILILSISGSTGISTLTRYYVTSVPLTTTFQLSATRNGTPITPGGSFSSGQVGKIATAAGGTGGSPTSTFTRNTSSPLRGSGDFKYSAAVNTGEGFSSSFTIDAADQARVLQYSFDYKISSGTFDSGGMQIWIYDVTNAVYIQPTNFEPDNVPSGVNGKWSGIFQSNSNSTSYRIVFMNTSTGTWNMELANISIGTQISVTGPAMNDMVTYTPTITGFGSPTNVLAQSRRVGDHLEGHRPALDPGRLCPA